MTDRATLKAFAASIGVSIEPWQLGLFPKGRVPSGERSGADVSYMEIDGQPVRGEDEN